VTAWERGDVAALVTMLADDAAITMPPMATWYQGREAIAVFLRNQPLAGGNSWRLVPTSANGQPAFGKYQWVETAGAFVAHGVMVLTLRDDRIAEITAFLDPTALEWFGLPKEIQP
jgi:RNA polymerase sigma-70 factor (ECF subfamily)